MNRSILTFAACIGFCTVPSSAFITGITVTTVDFSNGYVLADGSILAGTESVGPAWQQANVTTFRVWVNVCAPSDSISYVGHGSNTGQPLVMLSSSLVFLNSFFGSDAPPNANFFSISPALAWDSFITIGGATDQTMPAGFLINDPKNILGGLASDVLTNSVSWSIPPATGAGVVSDGQGGWRILIAQLSVHAGDTIDFQAFVKDQFGLGIYLNPWTQPPPPAPCPADIQPACGNAMVNIDDLVAVLNQFGPCDLCSADITPLGGNGVVNIDDLVAVLNNFGPCP